MEDMVIRGRATSMTYGISSRFCSAPIIIIGGVRYEQIIRNTRHISQRRDPTGMSGVAPNINSRCRIRNRSSAAFFPFSVPVMADITAAACRVDSTETWNEMQHGGFHPPSLLVFNSSWFEFFQRKCVLFCSKLLEVPLQERISKNFENNLQFCAEFYMQLIKMYVYMVNDIQPL